MQLPVGTIISYAGQQSTLNTPALNGWLLCDGSAVATTQYGKLYQAIGSAYGSSDGYFNLPDLRGVFLRGIDTTGVVDPDYQQRSSPVANENTTVGAVVGSRQADQVRNHQHNWNDYFARITHNGNDVTVQVASGEGNQQPTQPTTNTDGGGNETRPYNVYVYYLIYAG